MLLSNIMVLILLIKMNIFSKVFDFFLVILKFVKKLKTAKITELE